MKSKLILMAAALFSVSLVACSDDDDDINTSNVPEVCREAMGTKYPEVKNPKWERNGTYYTAEWNPISLEETEAWFKNTAKVEDSWVMTQTDYNKSLFLVSTELNDSFNATEYSTAQIDDIDLYEYPDATRNVYVIEVTPQGQASDMLLIFQASDCKFLKAVPDSDVDITPDTVL